MWQTIKLITIRGVSPPFAQLRAAAEARPNNSSTRFLNSSFIYLQRTQAAMEYYCESLHHKKYHVSSIHTIPSKNIAFIQVMFYALQYRSFTFGEATDSKQNAYIIRTFRTV